MKGKIRFVKGSDIIYTQIKTDRWSTTRKYLNIDISNFEFINEDDKKLFENFITGSDKENGEYATLILNQADGKNIHFDMKGIKNVDDSIKVKTLTVMSDTDVASISIEDMLGV